MSATYDPTLPSNKDFVRLLTGDTDILSPQFQDEEILGIITSESATGDALKFFAAASLLSTLVVKMTSSGEGVENIKLGSLTIALGVAQSGITALTSRIADLRARGSYLQNGGSGLHYVRSLSRLRGYPGSFLRWLC